MDRLFQSVWEAVTKHGLEGLLGLIPGGTIIYTIARKLWEIHSARKKEAELLRRARAEAEEVVRELDRAGTMRRTRPHRRAEERVVAISVPPWGWYVVTACVLSLVGFGIFASIAVFAKPAARTSVEQNKPTEQRRATPAPERRVKPAPAVPPVGTAVHPVPAASTVSGNEPNPGAGVPDLPQPKPRLPEAAKDTRTKAPSEDSSLWVVVHTEGTATQHEEPQQFRTVVVPVVVGPQTKKVELRSNVSSKPSVPAPHYRAPEPPRPLYVAPVPVVSPVPFLTPVLPGSVYHPHAGPVGPAVRMRR